MHGSVYSAGTEKTLAVNLLGIWRVTQVLQQCLQWWRISLWSSSSTLCDYTHSQTNTHTCSHARLLPAIRGQIGLILAHIPESTPLLHEHTGLCHRGDRTNPGKLRPGLTSLLSWPGPKSEAAWSTSGEIWLTRNQFVLLPVAWAEERPLTSNGCN